MAEVQVFTKTITRSIALPEGEKMSIDYYEEICGLMKRLADVLDEEYSIVIELLKQIDHLSNVENIGTYYVENIRRTYYEKLEQIRQLKEKNHDFIRILEGEIMILRCICDDLNSVSCMAETETAEQLIRERESFISALDSLESIDDDDATAVDAKATISGIATSISEASTEVPLTDQEKSALRRKQLADALRKGEPVTISPDGQISDISTADAIAALRAQLAGGGETMVNADGTIINPSTQSGSGDGFKPVDMACVAGEDTSERDDDWDDGNSILVPDGMLAGGHGMCRICGKVFNQVTNYCPECGTKVIIEKPAVTLDKVQFSAVAPKTFVKGDYSVIEILMYEEAFRHVVQEAIDNADDPVKETKSGFLTAEREAKITVMISSPDFEIEDNTESQIWKGGYLSFCFAVEVPEQYKKRQILFVASVYINDIIATRLKFVAKCKSLIEQKIEVTREDVLLAFVSYARQDRNRVAMTIQGMKKARPDMDIFFDVDSLRSGDDWEKALWREIDKRDVLFLCWPKYARDSKWVDAEWRYAFKNKGPDSIEPVPIDPPGSCPPPDELSRKHFNDKLLYIINSYSSTTNDALTVENMDEWW